MRALVAEFVGTALLLAAVVGSGIMGDHLAGGNAAIALLANTLATGAALVALILTFGPISGAHFNPVVSFADASQGGLTWSRACGYTVAQLTGATVGVGMADYMFREPVYAWSRHVRSGLPQAFSEAVATFGLLAVIWGCSRRRAATVPFAVGAYITAAYWFTRLHFFRESSSHSCALLHGHIRRRSAGGCSGVHRRPDSRCGGRDCSL